jgi:hypothetical protein
VLITALSVMSLVLDICTEICRENFTQFLNHAEQSLDSTTTLQYYKRQTQQMFAHDRRSHKTVITYFKTLRVCEYRNAVTLARGSGIRSHRHTCIFQLLPKLNTARQVLRIRDVLNSNLVPCFSWLPLSTRANSRAVL